MGHIWNLYETPTAVVSNLYAAPDNYPATSSAVPVRSRWRSLRRSKSMLDVILLAVGLGFFALSIAYAFGCERL